jgi:hypothetical protein
LRLSDSAPPAVDALAVTLAGGLIADDPRRAPSLDSSQQWLAAMYNSGLDTSEEGQPNSVEDSAEALVRGRLELMTREMLPAIDRVHPGSDQVLYLRPMRSRLHAAMTFATNDGGLILVDDAVHDLTISVARWITASWGLRSDGPSSEVVPPAVPLYDAVRVFRAELGSVRWNGSLWQPVIAEHTVEAHSLAALLGELAVT